MDGTALATGAAALAALLLLVGGVALAASARRPGPEDDAPRGAFRDDDLPGFLAAPPGTPPSPSGPRPRPRRRSARAVPGAAVAVLVVAAAVGVSATGLRRPVLTVPSAVAAPSTPSTTPAAPAQPSPGDPGAGSLAGADLPQGSPHARWTAAGIVLTRVPVGVVAGFPRVVVAVDGDHAVLHLELATADCLTPAAPARPEDAGCLPTASEFADLGTPALRVDRSAGRLTLSGRFPTYRRPAGAAPVWTGRSRDVRVTLDLPGMARGSVTVDGRTSASVPG